MCDVVLFESSEGQAVNKLVAQAPRTFISQFEVPHDITKPKGV